jgi:uncharacterized repeat protein (TIGR01451 family)
MCSTNNRRLSRMYLVATLSTLVVLLAVIGSAQGQTNNPIPPQFFGMGINNVPAAPWPTTVGVPFGAWRTLGLQLKWSDIETCDGGSDPTNPCYSWSSFDAAVAQAQTSGQDILYTVYATPQWASSNPTDSNCSRGTAFPPGSCDPPNDIDAAPGSGLGDGTNLHFRDFMTAITTHVGPGVVKYWEVWDEPNVSHSWRGTNAQLLRLAKDTYSLVKGADPDALITSPPYVGEGITQQFPVYLAAGGSQYVDVVAYHGYLQTGTCPDDCPIPENEVGQVGNLNLVIQAAGLSGKPIFDTEGSWGDYLGAESIPDPDQQVAFTGRYYLMHVSSNVTRLYWYSWNNSQNGHFYDTTNDTITTAGIAYQQLYGWMEGASLTEPCSNFNTQWFCNLTRSGSYVSEAIWDVNSALICSDGICPTVNLAVPTNYTQYLDLKGNLTTITNNTVPVGSKPILVEGTTPDVSVKSTVAPAVGAIGATTTYSIVVTNNTAQAINSVTVTDNLDPSLSFTSCSSSPNGACRNTGNNVTITFSSMASAETDTITIVAQVGSTATGTVLDTATANWISGSGSASDNWSIVGMMIGTPSASIKPSSVNFGNVILHTKSAAKNITVTNNGTGSLVLYSIGTSGSNNGDFSFSSTGLPITIAPKANTVIQVFLTPSAVGSRSGNLYVTDNASTTALSVGLGGNGVTPTTTTLTSSANPSLLGQSVTFTSKVSCSAGAGPTGTVTFKRLNTVLGAVMLGSGATATYTTSTLPVGWATITAVYSGDNNCGTSKDMLSQGVKESTSTAVKSSLNPSVSGQAVTFTATVSTTQGGTPTGTVNFKNGNANLASTTLNASGVASVTTAALTVGTHSITAIYTGTTTYAGSTSPALTQTVNSH